MKLADSSKISVISFFAVKTMSVTKRRVDKAFTVFDEAVSSLNPQEEIRISDTLLLERIKTFRESSWFKPKELSPVVCARWGWINQEVDTLVCENCGSIISCGLSMDQEGLQSSD
jgi:hypothetical protein